MKMLTGGGGAAEKPFPNQSSNQKDASSPADHSVHRVLFFAINRAKDPCNRTPHTWRRLQSESATRTSQRSRRSVAGTRNKEQNAAQGTERGTTDPGEKERVTEQNTEHGTYNRTRKAEFGETGNGTEYGKRNRTRNTEQNPEHRIPHRTKNTQQHRTRNT